MKLSRIRDYIVGQFLVYAPKILRQPVENYIYNKSILIPVDQLEPQYEKSLVYLKNKGIVGDYLEFGVFKGTSLLCMHRILSKLHITSMRLFGFDSFEGLPDITDAGDTVLHWHSGQFKSPYENTKKNLDDSGVDWNKVFLIKGWYSDTLTTALIKRHAIKNVSIIMVDCDLYSSAKQALDFCAPLIQKEAIIFFDDWESTEKLSDKNIGEKKAFEEFLKKNKEFSAEEFGSYYHTELKSSYESKIFLVKRKKK